MRPVNLIPPEDRRGDAAPARAGAASYIVVAVLFALLFAVTGVVLAGNSVSEKETELAQAEAERTETQARAEALSSFASFQSMKLDRVSTVASLADSRFDWERIMREVSLVLPDNVWLTNLTGTVAPDVSVKDAAQVKLRASVAGPALSMVGCARSQSDVAELIAAMGDIDGVTRVLAEESEKPTGETGASGSEEGVSDDCRTRDFIPQFHLVAAFDAVPVPETASVAPEAAPTTVADDSQTAVPEGDVARSNVEEGTDRAKRATGLLGADGG